MKIKVGDLVEVITGKDKGKRRRVTRMDRKTGKAVVENVNVVSKHIRPNNRNPKGGILKVERPIALSNLMFVCSSCDKAARIGTRFLEDGTKELFCKKCGATLRVVSHAK